MCAFFVGIFWRGEAYGVSFGLEGMRVFLLGLFSGAWVNNARTVFHLANLSCSRAVDAWR